MSLELSSSNVLKPRVPRALLLSMKNEVLGVDYELSVVFVDRRKIRALNRSYRNKDGATDILSFPLSNRSGEIIFCMKEVETHSVSFSETPSHFLLFLFIHGLCHLKGMTHGSRMETQEIKFRKQFGI